MANPCDKRVQQLTNAMNNLVNAVAGLNAQVTAQSAQLDAATAEVDAAEAKVITQALAMQEAVDARNVAWLAADASDKRVVEMQQEIARLQALLNEPTEPGTSSLQPDSIDVQVRGGEGDYIANK